MRPQNGFVFSRCRNWLRLAKTTEAGPARLVAAKVALFFRFAFDKIGFVLSNPFSHRPVRPSSLFIQHCREGEAKGEDVAWPSCREIVPVAADECGRRIAGRAR